MATSHARWIAVFCFLMAVTVNNAALFKAYDNSWCFKGVYDYDNCPEKGSLHECVRCCSELKTYYEKPPSKNVCLAACADQHKRLGIEWTWS